MRMRSRYRLRKIVGGYPKTTESRIFEIFCAIIRSTIDPIAKVPHQFIMNILDGFTGCDRLFSQILPIKTGIRFDDTQDPFAGFVALMPLYP